MSHSETINSSGSVYSTLDWLSNHFSIKSEGRFEYVGKLPIQPGDKIIDLGCANGDWARIMAERVGVNGTVCGVDRDRHMIHYAQGTTHNNHLSKRLTFKVMDIESEDIPPGFNIVTAFNTLSLVRKPAYVIQKLHSYIKENHAILILKDSAILSDFYWPVEAKVRKAISKALSSGKDIHGYNPDFALTCRKHLISAGFEISETRLNSYAFSYPFGDEHKAYIRQNARMILDLKAPSDGLDELDNWIDSDMSENGLFFNNPDSIYTTTEFTYLCRAR